jgi:phosphoribosylanthranilate isomerase
MFPLVKICGIREPEHALVAANASADLIGLVFVPGVRRQVSTERAREIVAELRRSRGEPPAVVGLFVDEPAEHINRVVGEVGLDLVQLSGNEPPGLAGQIDVPVIKALRLPAGMTAREARALAEPFASSVAGYVVDSHVPGQWGGTGVVGDWEVAARLAARFPVSLAGGLDPDNVADAIRAVRPAIVDVSSGVEIDGVKDPAKIVAFVVAARRQAGPLPEGSPARQLARTIREARARPAEPARAFGTSRRD